MNNNVGSVVHTCSGFVLVAVLIFMQVFSLISLYGLIYASGVMKRNNHLWYGYIYRFKGHAFLQKLETEIVVNPTACQLPVTPVSVLASKSTSWWQQHACSVDVDGIHYYYTVESLGDDSCGMAGKSNDNQLLIAGYYRITLYVLPDKLKGANYLLQSTLVLSEAQFSACEGDMHQVKLGRQSWREI